MIGFGLPRAGTAVPLVTVGLNPSNREIETERVPDSVDVRIQWELQRNYFQQSRGQLDWFNKSDAFLQAAVRQSHRDGIPHLDLSPQPTVRGFDSIYGKEASSVEQEVALRFLARGVKTSLFPLLAFLVAEHALKKVVMYGYLPGPTKTAQGGSATMKDFFWGADRPFTLLRTDTSNGLGIGHGKLRAGHAWFAACPELKSLDFLFLARGPSAPRNMYVELHAAGTRIRELGWL